ncbi:MAG: hypothetical protein QJR13_09540 [Bacillota bacterium]|nr:hypothetical protein [Bacillota bacterium]
MAGGLDDLIQRVSQRLAAGASLGEALREEGISPERADSVLGLLSEAGFGPELLQDLQNIRAAVDRTVQQLNPEEQRRLGELASQVIKDFAPEAVPPEVSEFLARLQGGREESR